MLDTDSKHQIIALMLLMNNNNAKGASYPKSAPAAKSQDHPPYAHELENYRPNLSSYLRLEPTLLFLSLTGSGPSPRQIWLDLGVKVRRAPRFFARLS